LESGGSVVVSRRLSDSNSWGLLKKYHCAEISSSLEPARSVWYDFEDAKLPSEIARIEQGSVRKLIVELAS
jgi:hypothetical protein